MLAPASENRLNWGPAYWRRLFSLALLSGSAVWLTRGYWLPAKPPQPRAEQPPQLTVTSSLDFGEAWESHQHQFTVEFHNAGPGPIHIEGFDAACDCVKVGVEKLEIPEGERRSVPVTMDLTRSKPAVLNAARWPVRQVMRAQWSDPAGTKRVSGWNLTGRVKALIQVEPATIHLSDDLVRGTAGEQRTALIRPQRNLSKLEVQSEPKGMNCGVQRVLNGYQLTVSPDATLPIGFSSKDVLLSVADSNGRPLPSQKVTVFGRVNEPVFAVPSAISLGPTALGRPMESVFLVQSRLGLQFDLTEVETPVGLSICSQERIQSGWRVVCRQIVTEPGPGAAPIRLHIRLSSRESFTLAVRLSWFGMADATTK